MYDAVHVHVSTFPFRCNESCASRWCWTWIWKAGICASSVCRKFRQSTLIKLSNVSALKSTNSEYIINGNYTVSASGPYEVAGTTIDYHRFDGNLKETHHPKRSDGVTEWITSDGPLFEPVHLMVEPKLYLPLHAVSILTHLIRFFHNKLIRELNTSICCRHLSHRPRRDLKLTISHLPKTIFRWITSLKPPTRKATRRRRAEGNASSHGKW